MFFLKSVFCRTFQTAFRIAMPFLPYREPKIINSCSGIPQVLEKEKVNSVLIVTDKGIVANGLLSPVEQALKTNGTAYFVYDKTNPNPTVDNVEDALDIYNSNHCGGIIAIGGGSSIDCAKAVGARVA